MGGGAGAAEVVVDGGRGCEVGAEDAGGGPLRAEVAGAIDSKGLLAGVDCAGGGGRPLRPASDGGTNGGA